VCDGCFARLRWEPRPGIGIPVKDLSDDTLSGLGLPTLKGGKVAYEKSALDKQVGGDHYKKMAIQPIEFCEKNKLTACETIAIRYICRHRNKDGFQDILKAIHTLKMLAEMVYNVHLD